MRKRSPQAASPSADAARTITDEQLKVALTSMFEFVTSLANPVGSLYQLAAEHETRIKAIEALLAKPREEQAKGH